MKAIFSLMSSLCPKIRQRTNQLKDTYKTPILLFFFFLCLVFAAKAQGAAVHAAPAAKAEALVPGEEGITPLKVGDKIPDELWDMVFPMVSAASNQVQQIRLGDHKDKLIILDFWSTWCGSCIYAFPSTFALANEFKDDLLLMPVGLNTEAEVRKFMNTHKNGKYLPESIMDKEILEQYFPHRFIPHFVWIYDGKVINVTDSDQLESTYVKDILKSEAVEIRQKADVFDFNIKDPFDKNWESLFERNVVAKTTLTNYVDGTGSWESTGHNNNNSNSFIHRSAFINRPLINIYSLGVNKSWNFFLNEASDKSMFHDVDHEPDWFRENTYCYELLVPAGISAKRRGEFIINDLNTKLNLNSRLETRMMDCYVLVYNQNWIKESITTLIDKAIGRMSLDEITTSFNNRRKFDKHFYQSPPILVNELENTESFFHLLTNDIDIESFNEFMKPQGIIALPTKREIEVFILSDY